MPRCKQSFSSSMLISMYTFTWNVRRDAEADRGSFEFSPVYTTGIRVRRTWQLRFYTHGLLEEEPPTAHPFRISLIKLNGPACSVNVCVACIREGDFAFYKSSETANFGIFEEDEFLFRNSTGRRFRDRFSDVPYTVMLKIRIPEDDRAPYVLRMPDLVKLASDIKKLDEDGDSKDFALVTPNHSEALVHKTILRCRSAKYDRELKENPEMQKDNIRYQYSAARNAVAYMYSGETESHQSIPGLLQLYALADEFGMPSLKENVLKKICSRMTRSTVDMVSSFACSHQFKPLYYASLRFATGQLDFAFIRDSFPSEQFTRGNSFLQLLLSRENNESW